MKSGILKMLAFVMLSTALLTGCAIENQGRRGRYNSRYDRDHRNDNRNNDRYHDRDHHYNNY